MPLEVDEGVRDWSFWAQAVIFWIWGVSLTAATAIYATQTWCWRTREQMD